MPVPVETVAAQWKGFAWNEIRGKIEADILDRLKQEQVSLQSGRQHLVEMTKEFKTLEEAQKAESYGQMFKEYQAQIDAYKKAFSGLESCLNEILKPLIVLEDPTPSLLQASSVQAELEQLKGAQKEAEEKSAQLKAATEELERLRSDNERLKQAVEKLVAEKGQSSTELETAKSDLASATNLINKLEEERDTLSDRVVALTDEQQKMTDKYEAKLHQKNMEADNLMGELEVLSGYLEESRQQCLGLQQESSKLKLSQPPNLLKAAHLQEIEGLKREHESQLSQLTFSLQSMQKEMPKQQELLEYQRDYQEIKRKYEVFIKGQFDGTEDLNLTVEELLGRKTKTLENELVCLRLELEGLEKEKKYLAREKETLTQTILTMDSTIKQYESMAEPQITSPDQNLDDTRSIDGSSAQEIITILTNQRERLKRKNEDLEQRVQAIVGENSTMKIDMSRIKTDYAKLNQRYRNLESQLVAYNRANQGKDVESGQESDLLKVIRGLDRMDLKFRNFVHIFLTNRMSKRLVLFYLIGLHIFLFVYIFKNLL